MGVSVQRHVPTALSPRERTSVLTRQEAEWASEPVWTQRTVDRIINLQLEDEGEADAARRIVRL
jgi:hypothetical protein